ncbi:hypothetical protein [Photobacterium damselae]|uniref:hypothetical protein n=1 Tax=Photobacterium damselae TaxID=38293 RepID=UPI0011D162F7|nr:hypothetical protein [Photobacterium damselae]KAB1518485.1 hypothetical protein FD717_004700 [Photobacterium damselae subsp. damselae]
MELLIAVFVIFIIYKLLFSRSAKDKNRDAILGSVAALGVPLSEATKLLNTQMDELSKMLHFTTMKESAIKHKPSYERMAHCIHILYKRQQKELNEKEVDEIDIPITASTSTSNNTTQTRLSTNFNKEDKKQEKEAYSYLFMKIRDISERDCLKYNKMEVYSRHARWGLWGYSETFLFSNDELNEAYEFIECLKHLDDPTLLVQVTNLPLKVVVESFNNEHRSITSTGFTVRDKETGHILAAKLSEGVFYGKVLMPDQGLTLDISPWREYEYPFKDDFCYEGYEAGFNPNGNWFFCIETEVPFSEIANLVVALSKEKAN